MCKNILKNLWFNSLKKYSTLTHVIYEQTGPKAQKGKAKPTSNPNEVDSSSGNDGL